MKKFILFIMALYMPMASFAADPLTPVTNGKSPVMATWNDYSDSNNPKFDASKYTMHIFCDSGSGVKDVASAPVTDKKVPLNVPPGQSTCFMQVLNTVDNVFSAPSAKVKVTLP